MKFKKLYEKKIAHSYTKRSKFEKCPRAYYEEYVAKRKSMAFKKTEHTQLGDVVHDYLRDKVTLGDAEIDYDELHELCYKAKDDYSEDILEGAQRALTWTREQIGLRVVEQEWALTQDWKPADWFGKRAQVFDRAKADFVCVDEPVGLLVDYKTGSSKYTSKVQLEDMAIHMFVRFPAITQVDARFLFLRELSDETPSGVAEIAASFSRVQVRERAIEWGKHHIEILDCNAQGNWPTKPSAQTCRFCEFSECEDRV